MLRAQLDNSWFEVIHHMIHIKWLVVIQEGALLSPKSLNRSLKSELTNIDTLYLAGVQDQFPCRIKSSLGCLSLPEFQVEGAIQIFDSASAFDETCSHSWS